MRGLVVAQDAAVTYDPARVRNTAHGYSLSLDFSISAYPASNASLLQISAALEQEAAVSGALGARDSWPKLGIYFNLSTAPNALLNWLLLNPIS